MLQGKGRREKMSSMFNIVDIQKYSQALKDLRINVMESGNLIVAMNQFFALVIISKDEKADADEKAILNILMDSLQSLLTKEIKKIDYKVYYSAFGLKDLIECYLNDEYMELIGFRALRSVDFNLVENGIVTENVKENIQEWRVGL